LTTGLSVCAALELLLPRAEISLKWPNDVHLEGRKVCGVLVEVGPWASDLLVLGIGVNVNNSLELAPDELKSIATSLIDFTGRHLELTEVLICVLRQLEIQLARLGGGDPGLAADWHSRCVLRGRTVAVDSGARTTIGVCQGIDEEGALVLLTEGGPARLFGGVVAGIW
jgi:BirA family biotin operon repressor/biotin-[acetyl-CoA-carboxylase] ligase